MKKTSLANIVSDIRESMLGELDFLQEGQKLIEFREFLSREGIQNVIAPEPLMDMSTKKVRGCEERMTDARSEAMS